MFVEDMPFGTLRHIYLAGLVSATAAVVPPGENVLLQGPTVPYSSSSLPQGSL